MRKRGIMRSPNHHDKQNTDSVKYKKCEVCGRVFKCYSKYKEDRWDEHRAKCLRRRDGPDVETVKKDMR